MNDIIKQIRTDLRLSMNGAVSASMRDKGVNYRMNFGVGIPRIKQISEKYGKDKQLAEILWSEDVRELKILATMIYPLEEFSIEDANKWISVNLDQEMREQLCKNLFQYLTYADVLVEDWIKSESEDIRSTGYWLFARLCIVKSEATDRVNAGDLLDSAITDLKGESLMLRQSAVNVFKFYGRLSDSNASVVMQKVSRFEVSTDSLEKEVLSMLKFEFDME